MGVHREQLPLEGHEILDVSTYAEYERWCEQNGETPGIRPMYAGAPFGACVRRVEIGGAALEAAVASPAGAHVFQPNRGDRIVTLLPVSGTGLAQTTRGAVDLRAGQRGAVFTGKEDVTLSLGPNWADLCMEVESRVFRAAYAAWMGQDAPDTFDFDAALPLDEAGAARLLDLTGALYREVDEDPAGVRVGGLLERWALALLRLVGPLRDDEQPGALPSLQHVRAAEDYMEAHLDKPLRIPEVARETGVGVRALQKAFVRWRGHGPLRTLKSLRLHHARSLLLGDDAPSVKDVAERAGFRHMGRFSGEYRDAFGEPPSETQARPRPRAKFPASR